MRDIQEQDVMWWLHRFTDALAQVPGPEAAVHKAGT
jgi:hypothetical protein